MTGRLVPVLRKAAPEQRKRRSNAASSAAIGSGTVVGGAGLLAGGIPGVKPDFTSIYARHPDGSVNNEKLATANGPRGVARALRRATGGGILGYRAHAHELGTQAFEADKREYDAKPKERVTTTIGHTHPEGSKERKGHTYGRADKPVGAYYRGFNEGKIGPEKRILRGMKTGRRVAHGALAAGTAVAGAGLVQRKREMAKSDTRSERASSYSGALAGTGLSAAAVSHGAARYLDTQGKRYSTRAALHIDEAGQVMPSIAGRRGKQMSLRQMSAHQRKYGKDAPYPTTSQPIHDDGAVARNRRLTAGVSPEKARQAGQLRAAATQENYFSRVFHNTARVTRKVRNPALVAGAAGVGGLAAMKERKPVRKAKGLPRPGLLLRRRPLEVTVSRGAPPTVAQPWRDLRTPAQRASDQARVNRDFPRRAVRP